MTLYRIFRQDKYSVNSLQREEENKSFTFSHTIWRMGHKATDWSSTDCWASLTALLLKGLDVAFAVALGRCAAADLELSLKTESPSNHNAPIPSGLGRGALMVCTRHRFSRRQWMCYLTKSWNAPAPFFFFHPSGAWIWAATHMAVHLEGSTGGCCPCACNVSVPSGAVPLLSFT